MGMAVIKCKMCGGDMELSPDNTLGTCEYCGSTMTMPKVDDEQRAAAFDRGNHFRRLGEFDKALSVYERIVQEDESDAEAHWCCALCRFGIEYVKDPATGEYLPTCHRASFDSFLEDVDYKAAVAHADAVARKQYEKDGEQIAAVQRGILSTVQKEEPFDVFICYKESDEQGRRTVDSTLAQDIYYQLTEQGRRVFFARITLEDKAGQEYEPYIFAALHSAKVMVVVGTKPEYLNAVWVRNEWSRYLALVKQDHKRLLIPCYRDMDPYDLPEQLSVLQAYDMGKIGFIQDLIRGISKVLDAGKKQETAKTVVTVQGESSGNLTALLKRGNMALEDGEWARADDFFEQVLNIDAECAQAYFGKAMAALKCSSAQGFIEKRLDVKPETEQLVACEEDTAHIENAVRQYEVPDYFGAQSIRELFQNFQRKYRSETAFWKGRLKREKEYLEKDKLLSRARRYAAGDLASQIQNICDSILKELQRRIDQSEQADRKNIQKITDGYHNYLKEAEREATARYEAALKHRQEAQEKARQQKEQEERKAEERRKQEAKRAARNKKIGIAFGSVAAAAIVIAVLVTQLIIPASRYKAAEERLAAGKTAEAAIAFNSLGSYQDAHGRSLAAWDKAADRETLSAGSYRTVGLKSDGTVAVVGDNNYGQCDVGNWTDIVAVSAGCDHTVGLKSDGTVVVVGYDAYGQCDVGDWTDIVAVSAGAYHTVGLKSDGTVVAVGKSDDGQCNVSGWTDIKLPNR